MNSIVIRAEHISKMYRLGVINNGTLWKDIQTWYALKNGKEDPNSKIGSDKYAGDKDHFWALKDLNFELKQGDRVGIVGHNGAGKSTLLKILSRVTAPTEGEIYIKGKISSLLEVGTGFHGELTGRENIYLNGAILGMKKRQIDRKLEEIINFSEIEKHIDTPVKRYSSGMYVRLAFAVASHLDSSILIADEVLAVGDQSFQKKAVSKMKEISTNQGRTVLFVSHNMSAVKELCSSGIYLQKGRIEAVEEISSIITRYYGQTTTSIDNKYKSNKQQSVMIESAWLGMYEIPETTYNNLGKLIIQLNVVSDRQCQASFEVVLRNSDGLEIASCPIGMSQKLEHQIQIGGSRFLIEVDLPVLGIGRYYIDLSIANTGIEFLDYCMKALYFDVCEDDIGPAKFRFSQSQGQGAILLKGLSSTL